MSKIICKEIIRDTDQIRLHEIAAPIFGEKGWYIFVNQFNAFTSGRRKGCSKEDTRLHRTSCTWGERSLYLLKFEDEYLEELRIFKEAGLNEKEVLEMYVDAGDASRIEDVPRLQHKSLKDFFNYIGFDTKSRRYRDPSGKPIRFCTVNQLRKSK